MTTTYTETKRCALCTRILPLDQFYRCGARRHSYCKLCHRDRTLELRAARAESQRA